MAAIIDVLIQFLVLFLIGRFAPLDSTAAVIVFVVMNAAVTFGYHVFFELVAAGRTPGKMVMRLRVVRADGGPIRLSGSLIRTFMRIIDFLPLGYVIGMVSVLATTRNQRLGDLAAGTVVVQEGPRRRSGDGTTRFESAPVSGFDRAVEMNQDGWDVSRVTAAEIALIRRFLERRDTLEPNARSRIAADLHRRLQEKVLVPAAERDVERILEHIVRAKRLPGTSHAGRDSAHPME